LRIRESPHMMNKDIAIRVLEDIEVKLASRDYFYGAAVFGSLSNGNFNDKSDIDIKLFRRVGAKNLILSYLFLTIARTEANIRKIPLDVYVVKGINNYSLKKGEVPLIIYDPDGLLRQSYRRHCAHS
jgi:predicted nucleotidyltransferase